MSEQPTPDERDATAYTRRQAREAWLVRRRRKIREEVERNRRGEHRVPTWVLALILVGFLAAWAAFVFLV
jgi:hypothetical protein